MLLAGDSVFQRQRQNCLKADFFHQWPSKSLPQDLQVSIPQAELSAVSVEHGWEWANQDGAEGVCSWGKLTGVFTASGSREITL